MSSRAWREPPWSLLALAAVVIGPTLIFLAVAAQNAISREVWKGTPHVAPLTAAPAMHPQGVIAYVETGPGDPAADGPFRGCIYVVGASGATPPRRVACPGEGKVPSPIWGIAWTERGHLQVYAGQQYSDPVVLRVGAGRASPHATPEYVRVRGQREDGSFAALGGVAEDTTAVTITQADANGGRERTVVSLDGPGGYQFGEPQWSPDERWILLSDTEGRLLIVDPDRREIRMLLDAAAGRRLIDEPFLTWHQGTGGS